MFTLGNTNLLKSKPVALFCSVKCPGELILKTYDLCLKWRKEDQAVISGFHSPMEKECLRILLQGLQPVIISPARGIWRRIPKEWKRHISSGKLLIVSKFPDEITKMTSRRAMERNWFIGNRAGTLFVSYAASEGKMERLCRAWIDKEKTVVTFNSAYNKNLISMGATGIDL